jgi:DNA-binding XRE family transcriptional regulator
MTSNRTTTDGLKILDRLFGADDANWERDVRRARSEITVGQQMCALRKKRGLTQAQLAKMANTSVPAISRIENANYDGRSLKVLRKLVQLMDGRLTIQIEDNEARNESTGKKSSRRQPRATRHAM